MKYLLLILLFTLKAHALEFTAQERNYLLGAAEHTVNYQGNHIRIYNSHRAQRIIDRALSTIFQSYLATRYITNPRNNNPVTNFVTLGGSFQGAFELSGQTWHEGNSITTEVISNSQYLVTWRENGVTQQSLQYGSPRRFVIGVSRQSNLAYDSWTNNNGTTVLLLRENEFSFDTLIKCILHEMAIYRDSKINGAQAWLNVSKEGVDEDVMQALNNPSINLAFKVMRAFRFEVDIINDLARRGIRVSKDPIHQRIDTTDDDDLFDLLEDLVEELRENNLHRPHRSDSDLDDLLDELDGEYFRYNPNFRAHTQTPLPNELRRRREKIYLTLFLSSYQLEGNIFGPGSGPRVRVGHGDR